MERNSFIFYKSFYESIKELTKEEQIQIYNAIFEYEFSGKIIELKGVCKSVFTLILPQLEANNKRYINGCKGGAPKGNQNATKNKTKNNQKTTKKQPNENENENENDITTSNIYEFVEENFGRTLSPLEYEKINSWLLSFDEDIIKYAIEVSVMNGKRAFNYADGILKNWKGCNYKTLGEIKQNEKEIEQDKVPSWFGKDIKRIEMTKEEQEEIEEMFKDFKGGN